MQQVLNLLLKRILKVSESHPETFAKVFQNNSSEKENPSEEFFKSTFEQVSEILIRNLF
jgi:hypothetical protein